MFLLQASVTIVTYGISPAFYNALAGDFVTGVATGERCPYEPNCFLIRIYGNAGVNLDSSRVVAALVIR
jgi:hypothetical protein